MFKKTHADDCNYERVTRVESLLILMEVKSYFIYRVSDLSLETAMFATTPGGMSDMGLISAEMGGNTTQVSIFHMVRVFSVIAVVPFLAAMAAE